MKKTEIYTYNIKELNTNLVTVSENEINNIIYKTEKSVGLLYYPNVDISIGQISFTRDIVINSIKPTLTTVVTIITNNGSLVYYSNFVMEFNNSLPSQNLLLTAKPIFVSGDYLLYSNIKINVQILQSDGDRILSIELD